MVVKPFDPAISANVLRVPALAALHLLWENRLTLDFLTDDASPRRRIVR